jgi:hypothetical protein
MKWKEVLLVFSALACLLPAVTVPLIAQQPGSPATKPPSSKTAKQPVTTSDRADRLVSLELQQRCTELLKPIERLKHMRTVERRAEADKVWDSFFGAKSDPELESDGHEYSDCAINLPNPLSRRDAFQAYRALMDEQDLRLRRETDAFWGKAMEQEQQKQQAMIDEINKQKDETNKAKAAFADAANFAIVLFKEYQQYKEAYEEETRFYDNLKERYHQTYDIAVEAINLAGNRLSLPTFVSAPAPQVIRVETPAVPRSLHCTANTMPPAVPGAATWTWTDCRW